MQLPRLKTNNMVVKDFCVAFQSDDDADHGMNQMIMRMTCRLVESVLTQGTRQGERQLCGAARASRTGRIEAQNRARASLTVLSVRRPSYSSKSRP